MGRAEINTGGSVANTGLALRFFGVETALMGKIGDDPFGELVRAALDARGGSEGLIVDKGSDTSYSVVLAPPGTDRIFLHDPGANGGFSASDIPEAELEGADWFHFGYPPLMAGMYAGEGEELERVFKKGEGRRLRHEPRHGRHRLRYPRGEGALGGDTPPRAAICGLLPPELGGARLHGREAALR